MTKDEAIFYIKELQRLYASQDKNVDEAIAMASEALQSKWTPVKWHEITDEEREREGYPENWGYLLDCIMPDDGQRILVTTKNGFVEMDECYCDGEYVLESGDDWKDDVLAWQPLPEPYKESEE